jgi:hypothetical protein
VCVALYCEAVNKQQHLLLCHPTVVNSAWYTSRSVLPELLYHVHSFVEPCCFYTGNNMFIQVLDGSWACLHCTGAAVARAETLTALTLHQQSMVGAIKLCTSETSCDNVLAYVLLVSGRGCARSGPDRVAREGRRSSLEVELPTGSCSRVQAEASRAIPKYIIIIEYSSTNRSRYSQDTRVRLPAWCNTRSSAVDRFRPSTSVSNYTSHLFFGRIRF